MGDRKSYGDMTERGKRKAVGRLLEAAGVKKHCSDDLDNPSSQEPSCSVVDGEQQFNGRHLMGHTPCAANQPNKEEKAVDPSSQLVEGRTPDEECVSGGDDNIGGDDINAAFRGGDAGDVNINAEFNSDDEDLLSLNNDSSNYVSSSDNESEGKTEFGEPSLNAADVTAENVVLDRRALYEGAPLTFIESMLAILTLTVSHNITGSLLADILTLINLHLIQRKNVFKTSLFQCRKFLNRSGSELVKHFYCSHCGVTLSNAKEKCATCTDKSNENSFFLTISIIDQLQEMFLRKGFFDLLGHRFHKSKQTNNLEDIYDDKLYKQMIQRGLLVNPADVSFMWYTDGVPVFKSTKISMWPLYLVINELPYKDRFKKENVILAGLWVGAQKPNANLFVSCLADELQKLKNGVKLQVACKDNRVCVRGFLLCGTCDLPAKSLMLNLVQFNGYFGCPTCEQRGERVSLPNGNFTHVYPYDGEIVCRSSKMVKDCARTALELNEPEKGVKGASAFSGLMPDFMSGMSIDVMHGVFSGVVKRLLELWFDTKLRGEVFFLSSVERVVSERLSKLKPPNFVERLPRGISDLAHWKATEYRTWFFYYSPIILKDLMKAEYHRHYLSFVQAIVLSANSVSESAVDTSRKLLHNFVKDCGILYAVHYCTVNVYQLLHLPECVQNLGPLWVYSCFRFEDMNGYFLKLVHGTNYVSTQVARSHWYRLRLPRYLEAMSAESPVRDFLSAKKNRVKLHVRVYSGCYSVGSEKLLGQIPPLILDFVESKNLNRHVWMYNRLFKKGMIYVSESYQRCTKTKSSYVEYSCKGKQCIGRVLYFVKVCDCDCERTCDHTGDHFAYVEKIKLQQYSFEEFQEFAPPHLHECFSTDNHRLVPVSDVGNMCVFVGFSDSKSYIGKLVNTRELE